MGKRGLIVALIFGSLLAVAASPAHAAFGIAQWNASVYAADYTGPGDSNYYTQAGGHPFVGITDFTMNTAGGAPDGGAVSDVRVDVPPGLISNPQAIPQCTAAQFPSCPADTQIGIVQLSANTLGVTIGVGASVYNMVPPAGQVSDFAFFTIAGRTDILGGVRSTSDDGLYFTIKAPTTPALVSSTLAFWGVPGDSGHDPQRGWACINPLGACTPPASGASSPSGPAFLTLPTNCVPAGQVTRLTVQTADGTTARANSVTPVPASGCASVPFNPSLTFTPQPRQANAPAGLGVDLHVPQSSDSSVLGSAHLRNATVTLPTGMALSTAAANSLAACTPAQFGHGSDAAPTCPAQSKIGEVEIDTPLLAAPLKGQIYFGCDGPNAKTPCPISSGIGYLYLYATGNGITQKLIGKVAANPANGRVTATFVNQPQVPFSDLKLTFDPGADAQLINPSTCGTVNGRADLAPWAAKGAAISAPGMTIDQSCGAGQGFSPGLAASLASNAAGGSSPFTFTLTRASGQNVETIDATLPPGLLAQLKGVPLCPNAAAATGACPAATRIGHAVIDVGEGSSPLSVPQAGKAPTAVYLAGRYKRAPYSLVVVVPAQGGPFDLGTLVVRAGIYIDPEDAHVTVRSDPLPQIISAVPLRYRKVQVTIDREDFMRSPTSCSPLTVAADAVGTPLGRNYAVAPDSVGIATVAGAAAHVTTGLQVSGCAALPFKPRVKMRLQGKRQRRDGGHPGFVTTLTEPNGQANLRGARVALPRSLALDPRNSQHVCDYEKAKAVHGGRAHCPRRTIVGRASAVTPLLPHRLRGWVYLVQGIRYNKEHQPIRTFPTLLIPLRGRDHVAIDLRAKTTVTHGKLVTRFRDLPDAQIASFKLHMFGASKKHPRGGILVVTHNRNICRRKQLVNMRMYGHNRARYDKRVRIATPCKNWAKHRRAQLKTRIHRQRRVARNAQRHGQERRAKRAQRKIKRLRHELRALRRR